MKYLRIFIREHKGKTALALLLLLGQALGTLLIPFLIAKVVDQGILKGDMEAILRIGVQMLAVSLLATAVSIWGSFVTSDLAALFGRDMRRLLLEQSQSLSVRQFDAIGVSSMITRATSDIANLQESMGMVLQLAVPAPIIAVSSIAMTAAVSPVMTVLQIVFIALLLVFAGVILKKSNALSHSIQKRLDRINGVVRESITGVRVIRAFANEAYEEQRAGRAFKNYADNMIRLNKLFAVFNPIVWLLMGLLMAAIVALGGMFALGGNMEVGEITAVSEYAVITISYLMMAAATLTTLPKTRACLQRLQEVLDTPPAVADPERTVKDGAPGAPAAEFDHVTFAYPGAEKPVIQDLSFQCRSGETTAIIGSTGSGKSTLADLLLRLHDAASGQIRVTGIDVRSLTQQELRERIGVVPQKAFLFSGTIAENLRMGRPGASDDELWEALEIAQAAPFVKELPLGLEAPVSQGGTNFSGGQRQRLSIARALVRRASILVFDDSFSALDVKTDAALRRAMRQRVTAPAKLVIAQRVSTILDADQILVLDEGRLAGLGTHDELMAGCAVYRAIAESQMQREEATVL